jgi:biopolymer transport protein ExbD
MGRFKRNVEKDVPGVNTSALPDIIFMLLFFFMVATSMKEVDMKVDIKKPMADQSMKLEDKDNVDFIYIGYPIDATLGDEPRIQLGDQLADVNRVRDFKLISCPAGQTVFDRLTSLKVDEGVGMKIVSLVKEELREINAIKINYSADEK